MLDLKLKATDNEARVFAVAQLAFAIVFAWWLSRRGYSTAAIVVIAVSVAATVVGFIKPRATAPLYAAWMLAAFPIGWAMSYVMASLVYFLVVTPIGLLARLFGHDGMDRKFQPDADTYWSDTTAQPTDPKRYLRQF